MKELITEQTAARLRSAISRADRTIHWLSERSGTPYSTLRRQVYGQSSIGVDEVVVYANLLGVKPSEIYPTEMPSAATEGNETERK